MFESNDTFLIWCYNNSLSEDAIKITTQIRNSPPARKVKAGYKNVSGFFSSKKMGLTIQFESHKNELARIYSLEENKKVIEYYDQPNQIYLNYESNNGKRIGVNHIPDLFVIYDNSAGWEECKTEEHLLKLESHNPNRYCRDSEGNWRCPPGESYAQNLGLFYNVISSKNINWNFLNNIEFFEDYYRAENLNVGVPERDIIVSIVSENPGISLEELFIRVGNKVKRDDVFSLIVLNEIYIDLYKIPVLEFRHVQVFENKEIASAFETLNSSPSEETIQNPLFVDIKPGLNIIWDGEYWQLANIGNENICLTADNKSPVEIPVTFFEQKMKQNRILVSQTDQDTKNQRIKNLIVGASKDSLEKANLKYDCIQKHLHEGASAESFGISHRTLNRWLKSYQIAEQECGFGYIGLIEKERVGNRTIKIAVESEECINEFINNQYETLKQKKKQEVYNDYELCSKEKGLVPVSQKTFNQKVKQRCKYRQTLKRQGPKAAYKEEPFYWILETTTPRHGNRPFHIAHMDHTEIDVEMRCSMTGKELGRACLSKMIDAFTRRVLAKHVSFEKPSYRTNMMLIRECVKRFNRLPQIIVVDGGKDFASVYFDSLLAMFECTKKVRPVAKSRFGTLIERMFGTTNTQFFHNLLGNTQITKNVRQVTKSVNPKNLSVWNLEALDNRLSEYCYEVYDTNYHSTLGHSPREAFDLGMQLYGRREFRFIPYDETFLMLTMPSTLRGCATISGQGIRINNIYYWSESFRNPLVQGKKVQVRFDPWNVSVAYIYLNQNWLEINSDYFIDLRNRSIKEIELACKEIRSRLSLKGKNYRISIRKLVEFLRAVENEEIFLTQRLRDLAQRNIILSNNLILPSQNIHLPLYQDNGLDMYVNEKNDDPSFEEIIEQVSENTEFIPYELVS